MGTKAWRSLRAAMLGLGALVCVGAGAHEFWMLPQAFSLPAGAAATLSLSVGENFKGDPIPFSRPLVAGLRHLADGSDTDLRALAPASGSAANIRVSLARAGTHVIALDTHPSFIELPAKQFHDYLRLEGLIGVLKAREAAGATAMPGRERYRRNVKTIVQAGEQSDNTFQRRTGQRLELVPLQDPAGLRVAQPLTLQVWFDNRPLTGALVKLWHGQGPEAELVTAEGVSDSNGQVTLPLAREGAWMASVVHMVPATGCNCDWDSYWGNLTFAVPRAPTAQPGNASLGAPRM
ncbi:DUF4198 domain-containing protein [Ramlibacter sp. PS3R-8]|uniref:DUF4198 domain-containing protein n=1 Tax=Ramlibacter sp. PS3R-8 TaxID=3133437 RepID=UPI0030AEE6A5